MYTVRLMQSLLRQILIISVLFMSTEGAWDMTTESHPHGDQYAHQADADDQASADSEPLSDGDGDHCGSLCHGHLTSITVELASFDLVQPDGYYALNPKLISNGSQAPPTPPPNA